MHIKIEPKRITQTYRCTSTHEDGKFNINQQLKKGFPLYNLTYFNKKKMKNKKENQHNSDTASMHISLRRLPNTLTLEEEFKYSTYLKNHKICLNWMIALV